MNDFEDIKQFLRDLKTTNIIFNQHAKNRMLRRNLTEGLIVKSLKETSRLLSVEPSNIKRRYKLKSRLSKRYSLVLIVDVKIKQGKLFVITAWKTNKKWQNNLKT